MTSDLGVGGQLGREHHGRRHFFLVETATPTPLDQGDRDGPHGRATSGRHRADQNHHGQADQDDRTPDAHPIHAADERGDADAARPNRGREEQGPAQPGQGQQGPIGLTQKHAAQGEPAEGPRHAGGLGQSEGGHVGGGATAPWGGEPRRRGHEEGFDQDEHECAVPIERPGPHEPQGEAADTGPPPRPQSRRPRQSAQTPVEQPGAGQTQGPPPPRRKGKGQKESGDQRRQQDPATARRAAHVEGASMTACAAALPLAMQAGMPTPR